MTLTTRAKIASVLAGGAILGASIAGGIGAYSLWSDTDGVDAVGVASGNLDLNLGAETLTGCLFDEDMNPVPLDSTRLLTGADLAYGVTSTRTFDVVLDAGSNDNLHGDLVLDWADPAGPGTATYTVLDPSGAERGSGIVGEDATIPDVDAGKGWTLQVVYTEDAPADSPLAHEGGTIEFGDVTINLDQKRVP